MQYQANAGLVIKFKKKKINKQKDYKFNPQRSFLYFIFKNNLLYIKNFCE